MPEDGMKPLVASNIVSNYFVFTNFHSSFFICFIMFHASMSAFSVGESGLKSSQDSNRSMFFVVFLHPKLQKSQEYLADRCCRATWGGKTDGIGQDSFEIKDFGHGIRLMAQQSIFTEFNIKMDVLENWSDLKNVSVLEQASCLASYQPSSFAEPWDRWTGTFPRQVAGSTLRGGKSCKVRSGSLHFCLQLMIVSRTCVYNQDI